MSRRSVWVALGLVVALAGSVYAASGWLCPARSDHPMTSRDAEWHFRNADPHHWRACLLQH